MITHFDQYLPVEEIRSRMAKEARVYHKLAIRYACVKNMKADFLLCAHAVVDSTNSAFPKEKK